MKYGFRFCLLAVCMLCLLLASACISSQPSEPLPGVRELTYGVGAPLPHAEDFFETALPDGYTAKFAEEYSFSHTGSYSIRILVSDKSGKETAFDTSFTLVMDHEPPLIHGVRDLSVCIGDGVSYRNGITVSDNCDGKIELLVDSYAVDLSAEGRYPVFYTAMDAAGNQTVKQITVYVYREVVTEEMLYALLDPIIAANIPSSASKEDKVRAVYDYVYYSVSYDPVSDKNDWVRAAYDGLRTGEGDCYTYFALSKAFFERLGIENIDIKRTEGIVDERHYWSLVNIGTKTEPLWYHFDATRLSGIQHSGCLLTDLQVQAYTRQRVDKLGQGNYFYVYDTEHYPKSAEKIITATPALEPYY